jgi:hypothetical protein
VNTVKNFVSTAIDRAVTTIRSLFGGAKERLAPGFKKTKAFLGKAKEKIWSITTVEGLKSGLANLRQSLSDTIANIKDRGISSALTELKQTIQGLFRRQKPQVAQKKQESPLWKAAFGMSKAQVVEEASQNVRAYMTAAHFNFGAVKDAIQDQKTVVDPSKQNSAYQKLRNEY